MLNETGGHVRKFSSNAGTLKSPFKHAIWRRAGAKQKCIENIERPSRNNLRAARRVDRHDRHAQNSRQSSSVERARETNQARQFKKVDAGFENARFATDRFKKSDNVETVIRKKLPSRNRRMQDGDQRR
ncbi:hypothetical protein RX327_27885 [Bradyrhizobium sp. BEA-2-5]|uniref:hypothetical protein n=1 Tax=Bradyrhizobium sp. BEA-2-5 TaxID=3080015 RepID=UPI00293F1F07|nr:hypothetical protein [Bradyrhizobium sp. BEA-2-5]WOH79656.1 hypothetical protein RX327_27885 [Bradyrhizobium sp. BEA-2-5]